MTSVEDQWSESPSGKRSARRQTIGPSSSRGHEEFPEKSNATASGRRHSYDDRDRSSSVAKADPRLDPRSQNGTYRDRPKRSTDEESTDRRANAPGRSSTRVTGPPDDRLARPENGARRTSSLRRDATLDDLERSWSARRDSRRSSFESDARSWETSSLRDVTSPRRTSEERAARLAEAQSLRRESTKGDRRDEVESRSTGRRGQQMGRDAGSRDRETPANRGSSQRRDTPDDPDRGSAKRSSGRSSLESDGQTARKTPSKETPSGRHGVDGEDRDLSRTIGDLRVTERQRSIEGDRQRIKNAVARRGQESGVEDARRQEARRSRSREEPKADDAAVDGATSSGRIVSDEATIAGTSMEIPKEEWACEHCTFINKIKDRVCVVCCKTKSSALPPSAQHDDDDHDDDGRRRQPQTPKPSGVGGVGNPGPGPEKTATANPPKVSNSEESGDSGSVVKNKGRPKRTISFSFGTKLFK